MGSLFHIPEDVQVGDSFKDILLEKGEPHPMARVRVVSIDDTGTIELVSAIGGLNGMKRFVTVGTLRSEYRPDRNGSDD